MRSLGPKLLAAVIVLMTPLAFVPAAGAAPTLSGQFELGSEIETNNKITMGPDGNMWFTLPGKKVGRITPAGVIQEFELNGIENTVGIATGPEGRIWVVGLEHAASFVPSSNPAGTEQDFNSGHINANANIALGPEGMFWVASNEEVAKFSPANFNGTIVEVPHTGELSPRDIDVAGSLIVISDTDTVPVVETSRIVTFTSAGVQKDFTIPGASQGVAGAPNGQIAYSAPGAVPEKSGLITPPAPASAFELLGDPFGVALGLDQDFWIVQFAKGQLTRLAPDGTTSVLGGLPVESARQIAAGPDGTLWVTLIKKEGVVPVSAIARISGLEAPKAPDQTKGNPPSNNNPPPTVPDTSFGKGPKSVVKTTGPKATVKFTFSSNVAGSTFQCELVKAPTGKKKKKAPQGTFVSCHSPWTLHLGPGKYTFAVKAVANGVSDPTPVERRFKVIRIQKHR